jgi:CheY-like chemotaxis protein
MIQEPLVLVVDDDPVIRMGACDFLDHGGYLTLITSWAHEALAILQNGADVDALLTDVVMPGTLDGLALASEVRRPWLGKQVIVASGLLPAEAVGNARDTTFVAKPFDERQLLSALSNRQGSHV